MSLMIGEMWLPVGVYGREAQGCARASTSSSSPRAPSGWNIDTADCAASSRPWPGEAAGGGLVAYRGVPATPPVGDMSLALVAEIAKTIAANLPRHVAVAVADGVIAALS